MHNFDFTVIYIMLSYQKELTPVLYSEGGIKVLEFEFQDKNTPCFSIHWHERMELLLVVSGEMTVKLGQNEVTASSGNLVIVPPFKSHSGVTGNSGVNYYVLMFDLSAFNSPLNINRHFFNPLINQTADFIPLTDNNEIVSLANMILEEHKTNDYSSSIIVMGKIYEFLGLLYRHCLIEEQNIIEDNRLKNVLEYIDKNFSENISSYSLSHLFGYDESYFCRRFKTVTGLTPMNYIQILRLEAARRKIKSGEYKIAEIALSCGFSDSNYFTRCFKKHYGITPLKYIAEKQKRI